MKRPFAPAATILLLLTLSGCAGGAGSAELPGDPATASGSPSDTTPPVSTPSANPMGPEEADVTVLARWAFDVQDAREVARYSDVVAIVDIVSVADQAEFLGHGDPHPYTPVRVKAVATLAGEMGEVADFTAYIAGGTVTLQQVFEASPEESNEKRGLTRLTQSERESLTETYAIEGADATLIPQQRFVLALNRLDESSYLVNAAGYGVFRMDGDAVVNVVTQMRYERSDFTG